MCDVQAAVYVRRAGRSTCQDLQLFYVYSSICQDLDYFIYLPAEHFIYMYDVWAAYDMWATVYVRIWDYFINLSGAGK
jgi:hypothetical protein